MRKFVLFFLMLTAAMAGYADKYKFVVLETSLGEIKLKLYENTPLHSDNFTKLVKAKHYDGMLFHRVIKDFMIQGGSSDSRGAEKGKMLGAADIGYTIDAEIRPENLHKKGALCAARQGDQVNPEKKSSGEQFYIVQGEVMTDEKLSMLEKRKLSTEQNKLGTKLFKPLQDNYKELLSTGRREQADSLIQSINKQIEETFKDYKGHLFSESAREIYKTVGGTPFLDGDYTVFGEVVAGMEILEKIAEQKTDGNNRPEEDVVIIKASLSRR